MSLTEKIDAEVKAVEADAKTEASVLFDKMDVDIREELPGLVAKLGVDSSDDGNVLHAAVILIVDLLAKYGPTAIQEVLAGA
jgi:hypothetical protein